MGFKDIIMFQIASAGKTLGVELREYINRHLEKVRSYSKQAYSKARKKISYEGYLRLNEVLLEKYYTEENYKTYKGRVLYGLDGCQIQLPYSGEITKKYGKLNKEENQINSSKTSVIYDLLNGLILSSELKESTSCERTNAMMQLENIKEKYNKRERIVVADRGYPSLEFFCFLKQMGYEFVIRYNGKEFLRETMEFHQRETEDEEIEIKFAYKKREEKYWVKKYIEKYEEKAIRLRLIKIKLPNEETEYLITSILKEEEFSVEDFNKIYSYRWNEEVSFNFHKTAAMIENFSGKSKESVVQDYYSQILVINIHSLIVEDAQREVEEEKKNKDLKYSEYKINKRVSYGILKDEIYSLLTSRNWNKKYKELVKEAKKHKIAVIPGRSFKRKRKGNLKFPFAKKRVI